MSKISYIDDINAWNSFRLGNEDALEYLIRKYTPALFLYGKKITKNEAILQDSIQDTFIELWKYRKNLKDLNEIKPYLLSCLRRKIIKTLKSESFMPFDDHFEDSVFEMEYSIEEKLIKLENEALKVSRINKYINHLSKRRKEIIYLKFYENLTNEEIASVMNIKYQTASNLLSETLLALKNIIPSKNLVSLLLLSFLELF